MTPFRIHYPISRVVFQPREIELERDIVCTREVKAPERESDRKDRRVAGEESKAVAGKPDSAEALVTQGIPGFNSNAEGTRSKRHEA